MRDSFKMAVRQKNKSTFPIIMLAADEKQAAIFSEKLNESNYTHLEFVTSGDKLLESISQEKYRLAIIDLEFSGRGSGIEVACKVMEEQDLPMIYIGKEIDRQDFQKVRETLPWAVFTKPVNWVELISAIDNAVVRSADMDCTIDRHICPIADKSVLGHQSLDKNGNIVYINQRWLEMTGYESREEVMGRNFSEFIVDSDKPVFKKRFPKFKKRGEVLNAPFTLKRKDGGIVQVVVSGKIVYAPSGRFVRTHCMLNDISLQERQKKELEEMLHNLEEAERIGKMGSMVHEGRLKKSFWSRMMMVLHGMDPDRDEVPAFGQYTELVHPDDRHIMQKSYDRAYREGSVTTEYRIVRKNDGKVRFLRLEGEVTDKQDADNGIFRGMLKDITEEKDSLFRNELLGKAIESSLTGFLIVDERIQITYVNHSLLVMCGYDTAEELLGKDPDVLFSEPEQGSAVKEELDRNGECVMEVRGKRRDGTLFDALVYYSKRKDPNNRDIYFGSAIDITGQKESEKELILSERRFRSSFDKSVIAMAIVSPDGTLTSANASACRFFGYSESELLQKSFEDLTHREDMERSRQYYNDLQFRGKSYQLQKRYIDKSGTVKHGITSLTPVFDSGGELLYTVAHILDITEQVKAEENLEEREVYYRTLYESAREGIILIKDNKVVDCNAMTAVILGQDSPDDIIGTQPLEFAPEMQPDGLASLVRAKDHLAGAEAGNEQTFEWMFSRKDGSTVPVEVSLYAIQVRGEQVIQATVRDITLRKQSARELERAGVILDATSDAVLTMSPKGKIRYWNKGAERIFGYSQEVAIGEHFSLIYKENDRGVIASTMTNLKDGDGVSEIETRAVTLEGRVIDVLLSLSAVKNNDGSIEEIVLVAKDISASAEATRALEESENRYKDLVEKSGVAILVDDRDGKIVFFNQDFASLFGYQASEIRKKKWEDLVHPDSFDAMARHHQMRMDGEASEDQYQVKGVRKDGSEFWLEVKTTTLKEEGNIYGTRNYMWDITDQKEFEQRLKRSNEEITRLSRHVVAIREEEQRMISSNLHDDLGQLLTALKMDVSWIRSNAPAEEKKIRFRAESAITITDQAMSAIREITSQLRSPVIDNLGLPDAIDNLVATYRERSDMKIKLELPSSGNEIFGEIATSIYRIIQESLTNILRHARASKVLIRLEIKGDALDLTIKDDGIGIDLKFPGSGKSFGIISMRERALQHSGLFRIGRAEEGGTIIQVKLPLGKPRMVSE